MALDRTVARRFIKALGQECYRQKKHLKVPGYPRPYYISYLLRDIRTVQLWGRLGNLNQTSDTQARNVYADVRVGSYRFDQLTEGGLDDNDPDTESCEHMEMPIGNDIDALKYHLWKLTDSRYRDAVKLYLRKKSQHITFVDPNSDLPSFRRLPPQTALSFEPFAAVDKDYWRDFIERSSKIVKRYPEVKNSWVEFRVRDVTRLFVNSEGSQVIDQTRVCDLSCDLWLLTKKGEGVATRVIVVTPDLDRMPDVTTFVAQIKQRVHLLQDLSKAPTLKSYAGPVLLAPGPAGILFHEVLGHRLEGSRLLSSREGQTFARDIGKQILPKTLTVYDDPTLMEAAGLPTVGRYRYDDEGTPAERVTLVQNGKLINFLSGRSPVGKWRHRANGHARSEGYERPISRMANLVIESEDGVSHDELKRLFREEIKRQKLRYGIMVLDAEGGETATDAYDFQAFMGQVSVAVQVWADGRENLVRNVNFVGTPLNALRNIIAVGDTLHCDNAFCGAESGVVPVSTTCPAVLMKSLELQASDQRKFTQYVVPMPYEKVAVNRGKK